jgi:OFA family oxalate/formate antiporter-like MFS transporter
VVVAAILGVGCGASPVPYNAIGFLIGPLHQEFGWSFRDASLGATFFGVAGALMVPFYGSLADRRGVRPVALWSTVAFGAGFAALGLSPGWLPGYLALWMLVGLIGIGSTPVTWTRGVNLWFFRQRGLALGLTLMGTSLAAIAVPRIAEWAVRTLGWRLTFPLLSLLPLLIALPVGLLLFREPRPDERPAQLVSGDVIHGATLGEALGDRRFWLILLSVLLVNFAYGGAFVHFAQMLAIHGFTTQKAAAIVSLQGVAILVGRIGSGALFDRIWAPLVTLPVLSAPALACWFLAGDTLSEPMAMVSAIIMGLATGAETDVIAYFAGRYFGMAHYGKIYGSLYLPFALAAAISPAVYGWVRDTTGSYAPMLYVAMGLFVAGALLLLLLGPYPDFGSDGARDERKAA